MLYAPIQIVKNQSMAAPISSKIIALPLYFGFAVQADYATSGTLGGTLALQASVDHIQDPEGNILNDGIFVTITGTPQVISGAGAFIWNIADANYAYFKLIYTPVGGDTGTLNAYCTIKGF